MADFFGDPTNAPMKARFDWTFTTSDARSRKTRFRLLLPANRANRFPPLSSDCTNPVSFTWLSGFARVGGKDRAGEIIAPVTPMNRRDWEGSAKPKTDFMGPLESATVKNI